MTEGVGGEVSDRYQTTIDTLEKMRREVCAYDHPGLPKPPPTCDCKYSSDRNPLHFSEATGCPELRDAISALKVLQALGRAGFAVVDLPLSATVRESD